MDEKRWWLVEGVIVEQKNTTHKLTKNTTGAWDMSSHTPRGIPFDCMPEWIYEVQFIDRDDTCDIYARSTGNRFTQLMVKGYNKCPKEWEGKTFPVTPELKKLIFR